MKTKYFIFSVLFGVLAGPTILWGPYLFGYGVMNILFPSLFSTEQGGGPLGFLFAFPFIMLSTAILIASIVAFGHFVLEPQKSDAKAKKVYTCTFALAALATLLLMAR